jgi:hypothetical protein
MRERSGETSSSGDRESLDKPAGLPHPGEVNRSELADFLRRARARLDPSDVGLTAGARRRTPGLRREEVAQLAAMSVDYYTRMEQSREWREGHSPEAACSRLRAR